MLKLSERAVEQIAEDITQYLKQGKLLMTAVAAGWQSKEYLEELWYDYIKRVDPHEKKYIVIINALLTRQAREVINNIKKYPDNYKKWTFNKKKWLGEFAEAEAKFITRVIKQEGQKAIDQALKLSRKSYYKADDIPISIAFDLYNPEVTNALLEQTRKFPAGVVGTSEEIIRSTINEGLELGENIDKLRKRVEERLGPTYIKNRAEMIARSETIYASNSGAELGYKQSGVVEGKKWLTAVDERTCEECISMDGRTASLGETFDIGDIKLNFDYTAGEMPHPPLHPRCRCTIIPIVETIEVFKPAKTIEEAEKYIKDKLNLEIVKYKGIKLDFANEINKNLIKLKKKYPKLNLGEILHFDMGEREKDIILRHSIYVPKGEKITKGILQINEKNLKEYKNLKDFNLYIKSLYQENWWTGINIGDLVTHEMGHTLTFAGLEGIKFTPYEMELASKTILPNISKYADIDFIESLAEAFVKYNRGDKLSNKTLKALQKYLGVK